MKDNIERKFSRRLLNPLVVLFALAGFGYEISAQPSPDTYHPDTTLVEIMEAIVAPAANDLWNAVSVDMTADGEVEKGPETNEDWAQLRRSAVQLAESTNLMLIPGRAIDVPGKETPDYQLNPEQIRVLMASNWSDWVRHSTALHSAAMHMIEVIDNRDLSGLTNAGGDLDMACKSCHQQFWYPN